MLGWEIRAVWRFSLSMRIRYWNCPLIRRLGARKTPVFASCLRVFAGYPPAFLTADFYNEYIYTVFS